MGGGGFEAGQINWSIKMSLPMTRNKLDEINLIPDEKLLEVYNFIHYFRLCIEKKKTEDKLKIYCPIQAHGKL